MIESKEQFLEELGVDSESSAKKMIYKGTDCGASLNFDSDGVSVGSIVEGCDHETETHEYHYGGFTLDMFYNGLEMVEEEAKEIWNETHGCRDCDPRFEDELVPVNPECKSCNGEGIII